MSQLCRMFLSNVGYKSAYYPGNMLDFCNPETGKPENSVIWLSNQGGKTTLISLLFTNIEPSKGRFVQHLQKSDHHFAHYFHATPGVIALELQTSETDMTGRNQSLVIGQCVTLKHNNETQRLYFGYRTNDAIGIDSLPFVGAGADKNPIDITAFRKWIDNARELNNSIFIVDNNQRDWKQHLEREGVEHELLAKQIDFCRSEGGISDFASFKDERNFLEQLFKLALSEETAKQAHETLWDAHKKYQEIPKLEEEQTIKAQLLNGFKSIHPLAINYKDYSIKVEQARKDLHAYAEQLNIRDLWLKNEIDGLHKKITNTNQSLEREQDSLRQQLHSIKRVEFSLLVLKKNQASKDVDDSKQNLDVANNNLALNKAVIAYNELKKVQVQKEELSNQIRSANQDVEPVEKSLKQLGSQLLAAYSTQSEKIKKNISKIENEIINLRKKTLTQEEKKGEVKKALRLHERTLDRIDEWNVMYQKQLNQLSNKDHLVTLENKPLLINDSTDYWEDIYKKSFEIIKANLQSREDNKKALEEKREAVPALSKNITELELKIDQLEKEYHDCIDNRNELEKDSQLCKLINMQNANPDDFTLLDKVNDQVELLRNKINKNQLDIENLEEEKLSLESDRLAKPDQDIQKAIDWLESRGVNALYYPHYLAKQHINADQAKKLVESDPARFYGIQVNNLSNTQNAIGELNRRELGLSRPIVISEGCLEIEGDSSHFVLPVRNDAAYNTLAGDQLLEEVKNKLSELVATTSECEDELSIFSDLQKRLSSYQEKYGSAWLEKREEELKDNRKDKAENEKALSLKKSEIKSVEIILTEIEAQLSKENERKNLVQRHLDAINNFIENYETQKQVKDAEKNTAAEQIKLCSRDVEEIKTEINRLQKQQSQLAKEKEVGEQNLTEISKSAGNITYRNEEPLNLKEPIDSLELNEKYRARKKTYDSLLSETGLDELKWELGKIEDDLEAKQTAYNCDKSSFTDKEIEDCRELLTQNGITPLQKNKTLSDDVNSLQRILAVNETELAHATNDVNEYQLKNSHIQVFDDLQDIPPLEDRLVEFKNKKSNIKQNIKISEKAIRESKDMHHALELQKREAKATMSLLPDELFESLPENLDLSKAKEIDQNKIIDKISIVEKTIKKLESKCRNEKSKVNEKFESEINPIIQSPENSKLLGWTATEIRNSPIERIINNSEDNIKTFQEILEVIENRIEKHKEKLEFMNSSFNRLLQEADEVLLNSFKVLIPDGVLHYSNKPILTSKLKSKFRLQKSFDEKQRKKLYQHHLDNTLASNSVDEDGYKLAAAFILNAYEDVLSEELVNHKGGLGIKIIKPHDVEVEYIPVDKMVGSGGEGLTAGLLLYLVIANIRGNQIGSESYRAKGSFLLLDNPFSKANKVDLIRPQTQLAKKLNIQLIFATGIDDLNALAEFDHIIKLRKDRVDKRTKRQYIENDDKMDEAFTTDESTDFSKYQIQSIDYSYLQPPSDSHEIL